MVTVWSASSIRYNTRYIARRADQTPSIGACNGLPTRCGSARNAPKINSNAAAATTSGNSLLIARFAALDQRNVYSSHAE